MEQLRPVRLAAILHGIRAGWRHFRRPPACDPLFVPGRWVWAVEDYLPTSDIPETFSATDGEWQAAVRRWLGEEA